jgi:hypothetical protein
MHQQKPSQPVTIRNGVAERGAHVEYSVPMGMHHHPLSNSAYELNNVEVAKRML